MKKWFTKAFWRCFLLTLLLFLSLFVVCAAITLPVFYLLAFWQARIILLLAIAVPVSHAYYSIVFRIYNRYEDACNGEPTENKNMPLYVIVFICSAAMFNPVGFGILSLLKYSFAAIIPKLLVYNCIWWLVHGVFIYACGAGRIDSKKMLRFYVYFMTIVCFFSSVFSFILFYMGKTV